MIESKMGVVTFEPHEIRLLSEMVKHIDEIDKLSKTFLKLNPNHSELKETTEMFSNWSKMTREYFELIMESIKEDRGVISSIH
jgi:hypothetical protein